MSFRELRNFTEIMRGLGYPRLISMENFRTPNFILVSDVLYWLVQRYDPNVDIPDSITTEQDRVVFLKAIAQLVYYKARIKLNIKKLYGADGYAVKELLKIAVVLKDATKIATVNKEVEDETTSANRDRFQDNVKNIRSLATELTETGTELHNLLEEELTLRKERQDAVSLPHSIDDIKKLIADKNNEAGEMINSLTESIESLHKNEETLIEKKNRRYHELEATKKRYNLMKNFRPAFMDEYEAKEKELQKLYTSYVERYRNIEYLENELEKYRKAEAEQIEANKRRLANVRKRLLEEEKRIMHADILDSDEENTGNAAQNKGQGNGANRNRPRAASGRRPAQRTTGPANGNNQRPMRVNPNGNGRPDLTQMRPQQQPVVKGNMYGDDDTEDEGSTETGEYESRESNNSEESEESQDDEDEDDSEDDGESESEDDDDDGNRIDDF
ncbi:clusterin-associated protein [Acrasis kona]|uniref:Clusterin-associated protein n=1 Tax=Acrasis kona TaxID=1008807 RepID=A0AAW2ZMU8_9EUKA